MNTRASRCAIWRLHAPPSRYERIQPQAKERTAKLPANRVTFLNGTNREFPKWRRHHHQEAGSLHDGQAQPANARKLERWSTNVDPQNGAEEIQFNSLDPTDCQTKITPEGYIDAG